MGMDILADLPDDLFCLRADEVSRFVEDVSQYSGLSDSAASICAIALHHMFNRYGGFEDEPKIPDAKKLDYHNGSHAAYVFAGSLWLAKQSGATQKEIDVSGLVGAGHDVSHDSHLAEEDERKSVALVQYWLGSSPLRSLSGLVVKPLLCTVVDRIGRKGIYQRARHSTNIIGRFVADADMLAFIAPNSGEIALHLFQEDSKRSGLPTTRERATAMLSQTATFQTSHNFVSDLGREVLHPLALQQADLLRAQIPKLVANYPVA